MSIPLLRHFYSVKLSFKRKIFLIWSNQAACFKPEGHTYPVCYWAAFPRIACCGPELTAYSLCVHTPAGAVPAEPPAPVWDAPGCGSPPWPLPNLPIHRPLTKHTLESHKVRLIQPHWAKKNFFVSHRYAHHILRPPVPPFLLTFLSETKKTLKKSEIWGNISGKKERGWVTTPILKKKRWETNYFSFLSLNKAYLYVQKVRILGQHKTQLDTLINAFLINQIFFAWKNI